MSRIDDRFHEANSAGRGMLIPFLMAGDPTPEWTIDLMRAAVEAGADVLELGVPFSDPMADGPVIQRAHERALRWHVDMAAVLDMVACFRESDAVTPVVLMGYLNPIEAIGYDEFARAARVAGVDGVIVVDMPLEESADLDRALGAEGIDLVFLLAPTTGGERLRKIVAAGRGFLYYVSLRGVTGARHLDLTEARGKIETLRGLTSTPIGLGFGIDGPPAAREAAGFADAVVVGSALVSRIAALEDERERALAEVSSFIGALRRAVEDGSSSRMRV